MNLRKYLVKHRENFFYKNLCWTCLKSLQKTAIVKSTYIWLFFVPLVAKSLSKIEKDVLSIEINSVVYSFDLELPFSWVMLFMSALLFVIGNVIYLVSAPKIIKIYDNYGDFLSKGDSFNALLQYNKKDIEHMNKDRSNFQKAINMDEKIIGNNKTNPYEKDKRKDMFADIFYHYNHDNFKGRVACSIFYFLGGVLFSIILIQNISWVFIQSF